jgi:transcription antitermination factor NusG
MPLLKRGTELFPAQALEVSPAQSPWWIAQTRSRQEKALARYLEPRGVAFYLPYQVKQVNRAGRRFVSYLPLFPGYVFFRGRLTERQTALRSELLVRVLEVGDQTLLNGELTQLRGLQLAGVPLTPLPDLVPGDAVRVVEGPFRGYNGIVVREQARLRLVVSVTMLRKSVAVEFDRETIEPIASGSREAEHRNRLGAA